MSAFLTAIGTVLTMLLGQFTTILSLFTTEPVLTIIFAIFVLGAVIGLVTRLYRHA